MVYLENRRYLPNDSQLRQDCILFSETQAEDRPPPKKSYAELKCYHSAYDMQRTGKLSLA